MKKGRLYFKNVRNFIKFQIHLVTGKILKTCGLLPVLRTRTFSQRVLDLSR